MSSVRFTLALLLAGLVGCATPYPSTYPTADEVADEARERLARLSLGMSASDVRRTMGSWTVQTYLPKRRYAGIVGPLVEDLRIPHPVRENFFRERDGSSLELLLYFTQRRDDGPQITDESLTPVVLRNDRLVARGWRELEATVPGFSRCDLFRRCRFSSY